MFKRWSLAEAVTATMATIHNYHNEPNSIPPRPEYCIPCIDNIGEQNKSNVQLWTVQLGSY